MRMQRFLLFGMFIVAFLISSTASRAQTVSAGPYYAMPSWDQTIACTTSSNCQRFVVLSNFNNEAVLDRETGLVWERTPDVSTLYNWGNAPHGCIGKPIGGRVGWRLPTVSEMGSLFQGALIPVGLED